MISPPRTWSATRTASRSAACGSGILPASPSSNGWRSATNAAARVLRDALSRPIELCRKKGYGVLYAHAQKRYLEFWEALGFAPMGSRELVFSDFDYVEVKLETEPHPQTITLDDDPYVIIRPEGRWDAPGILEKSVSRGVRPAADIR